MQAPLLFENIYVFKLKNHLCGFLIFLRYNPYIARSSNGRTSVSGTEYLGSNPSRAAVLTYLSLCDRVLLNDNNVTEQLKLHNYEQR